MTRDPGTWPWGVTSVHDPWVWPVYVTLGHHPGTWPVGVTLAHDPSLWPWDMTWGVTLDKQGQRWLSCHWLLLSPPVPSVVICRLLSSSVTIAPSSFSPDCPRVMLRVRGSTLEETNTNPDVGCCHLWALTEQSQNSHFYLRKCPHGDSYEGHNFIFVKIGCTCTDSCVHLLFAILGLNLRVYQQCHFSTHCES